MVRRLPRPASLVAEIGWAPHRALRARLAVESSSKHRHAHDGGRHSAAHRLSADIVAFAGGRPRGEPESHPNATVESLRGAVTDESKSRRKTLTEQVTIELVRHSVAEE